MFEELQDQYDETTGIYRKQDKRDRWTRLCRFCRVMIFDLSVVKSHQIILSKGVACLELHF